MVKSLIPFLISIPGSLFIALGFNYFNYKAYYATIRNTQTVDFNVLANSLPTKLSLVLQKGNLEEIQRTINSNYGLFGIVVTNCKEEKKTCNSQKVIAKSQPERGGWGEKPFPQSLINYPYDVLRNPAPITAEWGFRDARAVEPIPTGRTNKGKVIGRVYYIRRDPPDFYQNQVKWLLTVPESWEILINTQDVSKAANKFYEFFDSGANKYYFLTYFSGLAVGLSIWRIWERIIYKRKLQQKIYEQREKEASIRDDRYRKESIILQEKIIRLEESLLKKKKDEDLLKSELSEANKIRDEEQKELKNIRNKLKKATQEAELAKKENLSLLNELESAREQANKKWKTVSSLQSQLDTNQQSDIEIEKLQSRLKQAIQEASDSQKKAEYLSKKLEESSEVLASKETTSSNLSEQLSVAQEILKIREDDILELQKDLTEISCREKEYLKRIEALSHEKIRLETEKQQLASVWEEERQQYERKIGGFISQELDDLCNSLGNEIEELKSKLHFAERERIALMEEKKLLTERLRQLEDFETDETSSLDEEENFNFSSVLEALQFAAESCSTLEIWDSAIESAYNLNHYLPNKVYKNLVILNDIGEKYFEKNIGTNLDELFRSEGVSYSPRESSSTTNRYSNDRKFWHRGQTKQMYRHLKIGRRLRIYFEFDEQYRKVQIGYCGKHLQTVKG